MEKKSLKTAPPVLSASLREIEDGLAFLQDARREDMLVEQCRIRGLMAENEDFYKLNLEGVVFENCSFFIVILKRQALLTCSSETVIFPTAFWMTVILTDVNSCL